MAGSRPSALRVGPQPRAGRGRERWGAARFPGTADCDVPGERFSATGDRICLPRESNYSRRAEDAPPGVLNRRGTRLRACACSARRLRRPPPGRLLVRSHVREGRRRRSGGAGPAVHRTPLRAFGGESRQSWGGGSQQEKEARSIPPAQAPLCAERGPQNGSRCGLALCGAVWGPQGAHGPGWATTWPEHRLERGETGLWADRVGVAACRGV